MPNETNRRASLRPLNHPNVRGWTVVGADGRKVGQVRDLLADPEDGERFFAVELDQTALAQDLNARAARRGSPPAATLPIPTGRAPARRPTSTPRSARASGRPPSTPAPASTWTPSPAPCPATTTARGAPGAWSICMFWCPSRPRG